MTFFQFLVTFIFAYLGTSNQYPRNRTVWKRKERESSVCPQLAQGKATHEVSFLRKNTTAKRESCLSPLPRRLSRIQVERYRPPSFITWKAIRPPNLTSFCVFTSRVCLDYSTAVS